MKEIEAEFGLRDLHREFGKSNRLDLLFARALASFNEYEGWERFPDPGGLYDQPYEWKRGVEAVKSAKVRFDNEERLEEIAYRMRLQREAEEAEEAEGEY